MSSEFEVDKEREQADVMNINDQMRGLSIQQAGQQHQQRFPSQFMHFEDNRVNVGIPVSSSFTNAAITVSEEEDHRQQQILLSDDYVLQRYHSVPSFGSTGDMRHHSIERVQSMGSINRQLSNSSSTSAFNPVIQQPTKSLISKSSLPMPWPTIEDFATVGDSYKQKDGENDSNASFIFHKNGFDYSDPKSQRQESSAKSDSPARSGTTSIPRGSPKSNDSRVSSNSVSNISKEATSESLSSSGFEADLEVLQHNRGGLYRRMSECDNGNSNGLRSDKSDHSSRSIIRGEISNHDNTNVGTLMTNATTGVSQNVVANNYIVDTDEMDDNTMSGMGSINSVSTSSTLYLQLPAVSASRDGATLVSDRFFHRDVQQVASKSSSSPGSKGLSMNTNPSNCANNEVVGDRPPSVVSVPSPNNTYRNDLSIGEVCDGLYIEEGFDENNSIHPFWTSSTTATKDGKCRLFSKKPPRSPHPINPGTKHRRTRTPMTQSPMNICDMTNPSPLSPPKMFADKAMLNSNSFIPTTKLPVMSGIFSDAAALVVTPSSASSNRALSRSNCRLEPQRILLPSDQSTPMRPISRYPAGKKYQQKSRFVSPEKEI